MELRTGPSGPKIVGATVGQLLQWSGTEWVPAGAAPTVGEVLTWNGSEWSTGALPAPLPEAFVRDGPASGATSASTTYVGTASISLEVPAGQVFRFQWSGFVTADTGLTAIEHRVRNTTGASDLGGPVRREIANAVENAQVAGFIYVTGAQATSTYELQFRRAAGIGTATAQDMCLEAHRVA